MAHFSVHPKAGSTIKAEELAEHLRKILSLVDRVESGFAFSSSGLTATVGEGKAYINGYEVGEAGDGGHTGISLNASATNYIWLDNAGKTTVTTTDAAPTGTGDYKAIKIWEATTNATTVTSTKDHRKFVNSTGVIETLAALKGRGFEAVGTDAYLKGGYAALEKSEPYFRLKDTKDGTIVRVWLRGGKLEVTDDSGSTVHTADLKDLSKPVDTTSTDTTKDKNVSNALAKGWEDHKDAAAPHTDHLNVKGDTMEGNLSMGGFDLTDVRKLQLNGIALLPSTASASFEYAGADSLGSTGYVTGQLIKIVDGYTKQELRYDTNNGNRLSEVKTYYTDDPAAATVTWTLARTEAVGYDASGRMNAITRS